MAQLTPVDYDPFKGEASTPTTTPGVKYTPVDYNPFATASQAVPPRQPATPLDVSAVEKGVAERKPALIGEVQKLQEQYQKPFQVIPGELREARPDLSESPIAGLIPFREQLLGTNDWFSQDTAMEIAALYAAGKAIPAVARPIGNKIRGLLKLPIKPYFIPEPNRFLMPRDWAAIGDWLKTVPEVGRSAAMEELGVKGAAEKILGGKPEAQGFTDPWDQFKEAKGYRVAIKDTAGKVHIGDPGEIHVQLADKENLFDNVKGYGFVDKQGNYIPEKKALDLFKRENNISVGEAQVKPKENIIGEMARKDMEAASKLPPEEFPIMQLEREFFKTVDEEPGNLIKQSAIRASIESLERPTGGGLQSTIVPGGKEFVEQDLIPKFMQFYQGTKETINSLVRLTVPRYGVPRDELDSIMTMKGMREKALFVFERTTSKIRSYFDALPREESINFIDRIKKGEAQSTPFLQQTADLLRGIDDALYQEIIQYKPGIPYLENHYRVLWKVIPGSTEEGFRGIFRKPLEGTEGFFKKHTLDSIQAGIDRGGVPYTYNPIGLFSAHYADAMKFITANRMWEGLDGVGARTFVKFGQTVPEGLVRLDDKIARVFFHVDEGMVKAGEWYVESGAARLLNNFLSRDLIRESALGRSMMWIKNSTTAAELSFSMFHAVFESIETISSGLAQGAREIWNVGVLQKNWDAIGKGFKDIITAPFSPWGSARTGGAAIKYVTNRQEFLNTLQGKEFIKKFPDAEQLINDLFTGGGKLAMSEDYRINSIQTFRNALIENNYIGAAIRSIPALNEVMMKPLFEMYIPRLKIGMFLKEYSLSLAERASDLAAGKTTRPELARTVWDFVENRLGEMNFDNLFWDRTFKSSMQLLIRSVTWKLGNIRAFGNAISRQSVEFANATAERRLPQLTQEFAWMWGLAATTAAMAATTMYVATGKTPGELVDYVYPQMDQEGHRFSLPTYARDVFSMAHSPLQYISHSLSGYISRFTEVIQNKNFYGVEIHDRDEGWIRQRIDDLVHMVPLPFAVSSYERMKATDEPLGKSVMGFLGFTKAPFYIEQSAAEQLASKLLSEHLPIEPLTKESFARNQLIKKYAIAMNRSIKNHTPMDETVKNVVTDVRENRLHLEDVKKIQARLREPLEGKVQKLPLKDSLAVWGEMNEAEKARTRGIMVNEIKNLADRNPDKLRELRGPVQAFADQNRGF